MDFFFCQVTMSDCVTAIQFLWRGCTFLFCVAIFLFLVENYTTSLVSGQCTILFSKTKFHEMFFFLTMAALNNWVKTCNINSENACSVQKTCLIFKICFCLCSDPYVKLSLYVADENRELALVQTKTIKKVGADWGWGGGGDTMLAAYGCFDLLVCVVYSCVQMLEFLIGLFCHA